jgi:hypothetical protein
MTMSTQYEFDATQYTRTPTMSVATAISTGSALLTAMPASADPQIRKRARTLRASIVTLKAAWSKRSTAPDTRAADRAIDTAWISLHDRLEACANLGGGHPRSARAAELVSAIFPDGTSFLALPFVAEYAESEKRLEQIDREGLERDLDAIAGDHFLGAVRERHEAYGEALGITAKPAAVTSEPELLSPLRALSRAISDYTFAVIAFVDRDDRASVEAARIALAPIDNIRARRAKAGGASDEEDAADAPAVDAPVPPVPGEPSK